ncbi:SRPBCC domain-containing protein [Streptomyces sp. cg36]|uniref:SRPBCC domain-containing protein n=1 Tax=Streptomyces sp. cg36 TaxID=3238798 RepID=UPI0034E2822C
MEHEVFVPVETEPLRAALRDPARVARCVPGLQQDAGEPPVAGRLRLRLEGHTITYRGTLRITELDADTFGVEAEGTEARGTGAAKLSLTLALAPRAEGTLLTFTATATADGRVAEARPEAAEASATRLLDRFASALAADAGAAQENPDPAGSEGRAAGAAEADAGADEAAAAGVDEAAAAPAGSADEARPADASDSAASAGASAAGEGPGRGDGAGEVPAAEDASGPGGDAAEFDDALGRSVFDAVVPPPSLDPLADDEFELLDSDYAPVEAAHARRTMIGRSAEEVDHAPPRGRYAPVPAPAGSGAGATLRWVAPAAALALASAVVVGRALRRRR